MNMRKTKSSTSTLPIKSYVNLQNVVFICKTQFSSNQKTPEMARCHNILKLSYLTKLFTGIV